jgi:integrase
LSPAEVERLIEAAQGVGRHGHRDATMILIAYRHALRVSELISLRWDQVDLALYLHRGAAGAADGLDRAEDGCQGGHSRRAAIPSSPSHVKAWLRLQAGKRRAGHKGYSALPWPQEHFPHGSLHGAFPGAFQGLLARLGAATTEATIRARTMQVTPSSPRKPRTLRPLAR